MPHEKDTDNFAAREGSSQAEDVINYVQAILSRNTIECSSIPENIRDVAGIEKLSSLLFSIRNMANALSKGKLDSICPERGYVIGSLKSLQADLRHMTWQARCIARGDYQHRVNFLGDFSTAFNTMAEELDKSVTRLTSLSTEYKEMSNRDALTGLLNRRAFTNQALDALQEHAERCSQAVIIMVDIDYFKTINDTWGHACGDEVLRQTARLLLSRLRGEDICCRYGGEEFLLLLPHTEIQRGICVAEQLRQKLNESRIVYDGHTVPVTASFGVNSVSFGNPQKSLNSVFESAVKRADKFLYAAKKSGRNKVVSIEGVLANLNAMRRLKQNDSCSERKPRAGGQGASV
ncbi:MAG: GGDEF domain-containing protein [Desulfovibrio sp.]|nr:GGDEF domain-containing protein [Desulfovibrio sp.]